MASAKELLNRGNNLFLIGLLAVLALGDLPGAFTEGFPRGGLDEVTITVIAAGGVAWYWRNRYRPSLIPLAFIAGAIAFKVVAVVIEDKDDQGDDFGAAIVFVLATITWLVIYYRTKLAASHQPALQGRQAESTV